MIRAIPTNYNGTLFRSLLEARYAKLLDSYKVEWAYEVEGYEYDGIRYLPDFYLPQMNVLLEIKGPSIPGIEKPTNLRKHIEAGLVPDIDWWNPEVLILVGDVNGNITIAGLDEEAPLVKCRDCQNYFFIGESRSFECRICGAYDGDHHLEDWITSLILPRIEIESTKIDTSSAPYCPKCESVMVLRIAKTGASKGEKFWGCSKFPQCKGTRPFKGF